MSLRIQGIDELEYWPPIHYDEFGAFVPGRFALRLCLRLENRGSIPVLVTGAALAPGWFTRRTLAAMVGSELTLAIYPEAASERTVPPAGAIDLALVFDRELTDAWTANLSDQMKWRSEKRWYASLHQVQKILKRLAAGRAGLRLTTDRGPLTVRMAPHLSAAGALTRNPEQSPHHIPPGRH